MKRKNLLILVLLFLMSFNTLHAFVLDVLDTHVCEVSEYVDEFSYSDKEFDGDICHLHAAFHTSVILHEAPVVVAGDSISLVPSFFNKAYSFDPHKNFFKPPILIS